MDGDEGELLSGREAAAELSATTGIGLRQARAALAAGLGGAPRAEGRTRLYRERDVTALADRPLLDVAAESDCWRGLLVLRRTVPLGADWAERVGCLATGWDLSIYARIRIRLALADPGDTRPVLALGAVGGFVHTVAAVQDVTGRGRERWSTVLQLDEPPASSTWLAGTRLSSRRTVPWEWHEHRVRAA